MSETMSDYEFNGQPKQKKTLTEAERAQLEALRQLEILGGGAVAENDLEFGPKLILSQRMSIPNHIEFLREKQNELEEEVGWNRKFPYRPLDGAAALVSAIRKAFGTLQHKPTMGWFGPNPPQLIEVEVGFGQVEQVPWGHFEIPALPGVGLWTGSTLDDDLGEIFTVHASGKRKHGAMVEGLFKLIEEELKSNSIYKGKAIDAGFSFLDLSRVSKDTVVYAEDVYAQLEASVLAAVRYPDLLEQAGVPFKSAVLLSGTYGVGKTLFAYLVAQECEENGLTFIQVRPNRDNLESAMQAARMYAPAVVFFEDLDTISSADEASDHISGLLELFDGVRAKGVPVMAILTTNHANRIHKGMVRPGRLDAVINITPPDHDAIIRLCQVLIPGDLLDPTISKAEWDAVAEAADGYVPAFVHEGCKRAIRYAIVREFGDNALDPEGEEKSLDLSRIKIQGEDLRLAMVQLRSQYDLQSDAKDLAERDPLSTAIQTAIRPVVEAQINAEFDRLEDQLFKLDREEVRS